MLIAYARVSTTEQNLDLQTDALNRAGCKKLFTDLGVLWQFLQEWTPAKASGQWRISWIGALASSARAGFGLMASIRKIRATRQGSRR